MEASVRGIVLRRRDSGEADRRLTLLTVEYGKLDVVAKGAKKSASRLAAASEPLTVGTYTLALGRRTRYVTQAALLSGYRNLRRDYDRLSLAFAFAEVAAGVIPWEEPDEGPVDFVERALAAIDGHARPLAAAVWAQVGLLQLSGFLPDFSACVVTGVPVREANPFLSPLAGGLLSESAAVGFSDRFRVRSEVVIALLRLGELESPPDNLKFAADCFRALVPFWRTILESPLPCTEAALAELME